MPEALNGRAGGEEPERKRGPRGKSGQTGDDLKRGGGLGRKALVTGKKRVRSK